MQMDKTSVILIVDDSKENIDILRSTLSDTYRVSVAISGEMALKAMAVIQPDLVLLDVIMPGMDGFEVLRVMKRTPAYVNIPVIFITGEMNTYSEATGLMLGAVDYITKPYNPDIVSIKVKNQLVNKMYRDRLEHLVEQRTHELLASRDAIIMGMSLVAEGRCLETGSHLQGIKRRTAMIANKYDELYPGVLPRDEIERIIRASPLHDVGKTYISDIILLKEVALTKEEFEHMKMHTILGANVLRETEELLDSNTELLDTAVEIALGHHEKYDGTGYPYAKKGDEIPISARIVALADVFDALVSTRAYKKAFTREEAINAILNGNVRTEPSHFDPMILNAFRQVADVL